MVRVYMYQVNFYVFLGTPKTRGTMALEPPTNVVPARSRPADAGFPCNPAWEVSPLNSG